MKKHILAIIMSLLCLSLMLALSACGGNNSDTETEECAEHTFGDWEISKYSTCTLDGKKFRECTVCGFSEEEIIIGEHKWGEWETITELSNNMKNHKGLLESMVLDIYEKSGGV